MPLAYICTCVRKKHNKGGSTSVLVVDKSHDAYKILKNFGDSNNEIEISSIVSKAEEYILEKTGLSLSLFPDEEDILITEFASSLSNSQIQVIGPELIFGSLYDHIGYKKIDNAMFRYLVLSRLASPGSKLKTIDYFYRFQGVSYSIDKIYRFLDNLCDREKKEAKTAKEEPKPDLKTHGEALFSGSSDCNRRCRTSVKKNI